MSECHFTIFLDRNTSSVGFVELQYNTNTNFADLRQVIQDDVCPDGAVLPLFQFMLNVGSC